MINLHDTHAYYLEGILGMCGIGDVVKKSLYLMVKPGKVIASLSTCDFVGLVVEHGESLHTTKLDDRIMCMRVSLFNVLWVDETGSRSLG